MATKTSIDSLWLDANIATFATDQPYGALTKAALAIADSKIVWVGPQNKLPARIKKNARQIFSANNLWLTPGLIDCHTHLVYAGNRANEFELRLQGKNYQEIAAQGGGIWATVLATRMASEQLLFQQSCKRLQTLMSEGVTTVEIKSGYGLDLETETKCLRIAHQLENAFPVTIKKTYLGAHIIPNEYKENINAYVTFICDEVMPSLVKQKLIDAVDAFCESIAFKPEHIERIFTKAKQLNLPVKLHTDQLSSSEGTLVATRYQALSCDHLEYVNENSIQHMAGSGTVAVLLPGAFYFLGTTKKPPVELLRNHALPIAIATDCNPGTSPMTSLLLAANMACTLFGLTPEESLCGITRNAAKALGLEKAYGQLAPGYVADFVVWDIEHPRELAYYIGYNPCKAIVKNGIYYEKHQFTAPR